MSLWKYLVVFVFGTTALGQTTVIQSAAGLPEAPSYLLFSARVSSGGFRTGADNSSSLGRNDELAGGEQEQTKAQPKLQSGSSNASADVELDANGNPIPLERREPKRILGFMPNFRSVSSGAVVHPLGWKYNFAVATHQATDYSSFVFLGLTSISAEGLNSHPALGKGVGGFYAYTWRGFVDKTDGTYLSAWLLPSLLHEDTRYYVLGRGSITKRSLYVISREAVARTYGGRETPNLAGLGGKVLTQVISRTYYPPSAADFPTLATKFGYSVMRDIGFNSIREFYPTVAAHYVRKHHEHQLRLQQQGQP